MCEYFVSHKVTFYVCALREIVVGAPRTSGADAGTQLWQVQLTGPAKGSFSYQLLSTAREALLAHPNPKVRSLTDMETVLHLRVILGGPPPSGASDPDNVGLVDWQLVIYCAGPSPKTALDFVDFVLQHKIKKGGLTLLPDLQVHMVTGAAEELPSPWRPADAAQISVPKPFGALPPRGRRHVLAQLEKEEGIEEGESGDSQQAKYILTFYGAIYQFKDAFDQGQIPGAYMETGTPDQRDYVRYVELTHEANAMQKVLLVLQDALKGLPVYFVNMVDPADEMGIWTLEQPSIIAAENTASDAT